MGIGSSFRKAIKKAGNMAGVGSLKQYATTLFTGDVPLRFANESIGQLTGGTNATSLYQDITGHTARAESEAKAARQVAENKVLADANSNVNKDAADVVLGETSDTAGTSLTDLRKKKSTALSTQLGIA